MKLAIITDTTCDFGIEALRQIKVEPVPLYVHFKGETFKDWIDINPKDIVEGVQAGAGMPSTSQPSPQEFIDAYARAAQQGAEEILCITISSGLSGTYQSATIAQGDASVPVTVFDSKAASLGIGMMVKRAVDMREQGSSLSDIVKELERIREQCTVRFTVDNLDFLQKNGRIGGAQALLGGLLNIKPILSVIDGKVVPAGKARGAKKALREIVKDVSKFSEEKGKPVMYFLHVQKPEAAEQLRQELRDNGIDFVDAGTYEIGAVIASHTGPGTYGAYFYPEN